jgi:hypothetical protein
MAFLPIFHGSRHSSLSAVMTFPRDLATAKICAGWLIASARAPELLRLGNSNHDSIIDLVNDAVQMVPLYEEYLATTSAGFKAGVVVHALLSLIDQNPQTANWERAIEVAERMAQAAPSTSSFRAGNRSSFRAYLSQFQPVLHLWGALCLRYSIYEPKSPNHFFIEDCSTEYYVEIDVRYFAREATMLLDRLRQWNDARSVRSHLLTCDAWEFGREWDPPRHRRSGWPPTGQLLRASLVTERVPEVHLRGRQKKLSS